MSRDQKLKMKEIGKLVAHSCFMILIFEEDSEKKIRVPDGIWTHDPPWSSRML